MLVDYAGTEDGCLDYYSDAASNGKTIRGLGLATLSLHVAQCLAFQQTEHITKIKDFKTDTKFKEARERFHYKNDADEQKIVPFSCLQTIPRRVSRLYNGRYISQRDELFKALNDSSPGDQ
eukprot:scaffold421387_cov78-Attheya_sp.AAC.1